MKKAILALALVVSLSLIPVISCGNTTQPPSGELPVWKVGDTWTMISLAEYEASDLISIYTVTGEQVLNGIDCYIIQKISTMEWVLITDTMQVDKATMADVSIASSISWNGTVYTGTKNISYDYSVQPYPLSVGKTWSLTVNTTATGYFAWQNQSVTETYSYTEIVEGVENITVPAGTFLCFRIVRYNYGCDCNCATATRWVTDVIRGIPVKTLDNGVKFELTSYSLSE